ncbi:MAG: peptidoglycan-binding protein [Parcubacteria group bacterium]|nr:peptidoglycan-binding protein [Parcubacteria group bacterium]MCR4342913.1 peptidoglycan-binding protein [Patescibacteria group bacterium]
MKKGIIIGIMVLALGFSQAMPAFAQDTASDLQALITSLMEQVKTLQEQIKSLNTEVRIIKTELQLTRSLYKGISGDDVAKLQEFLKSDSDVYPEGIVSGYFGFLTEKAIKKFQKKHGIEDIGIVGPKTIRKLNELLEHGAGKSGKVPPGLLIAPGIAKKLSLATTTPLSLYIHHDESDDRDCEEKEKKHKKEKKHDKKDHGDDDGDDDDDNDDCDSNGGDTATTTPPVADITAPVISSVGTSGITAISSLASWLTDEASDSKAWYATTTPVDVLNTPQASSTALELSHGLTFSGLSASTTYYFLVSSSDVSGNAATSTEQTFTTLGQ